MSGTGPGQALGGLATAAAFLHRSVVLSGDPKQRLRHALAAAQARLRAATAEANSSHASATESPWTWSARNPARSSSLSLSRAANMKITDSSCRHRGTNDSTRREEPSSHCASSARQAAPFQLPPRVGRAPLDPPRSGRVAGPTPAPGPFATHPIKAPAVGRRAPRTAGRSDAARRRRSSGATDNHLNRPPRRDCCLVASADTPALSCRFRWLSAWSTARRRGLSR